MNRPDAFSEFITYHLRLDDEVFTPVTPPAPTDPRWHYGQYQAASTVTVYSQPNTLYDYGYGLRPTKGYAHAMLRYLPNVRPDWTAIELTMGNPLIAYVRNDAVNFRRSSGAFEYMLMLQNLVLIVVGLSLLIFLYAIPQGKSQPPNRTPTSSSFEQRVERFVARLENSLFPLQ